MQRFSQAVLYWNQQNAMNILLTVSYYLELMASFTRKQDKQINAALFQFIEETHRKL